MPFFLTSALYMGVLSIHLLGSSDMAGSAAPRGAGGTHCRPAQPHCSTQSDLQLPPENRQLDGPLQARALAPHTVRHKRGWQSYQTSMSKMQTGLVEVGWAALVLRDDML